MVGRILKLRLESRSRRDVIDGSVHPELRNVIAGATLDLLCSKDPPAMTLTKELQ